MRYAQIPRVVALIGFKSLIAVAVASSARAVTILSPADQFVLLGIGGEDATHRGSVSINSSTSIIGNVCYNRFTTSTVNQKIDTFTGTSYVHSEVAPTGAPGAFWDFAAATYVPSGGIQYGSANAAVDTLLQNARTSALAASSFYGGLGATQSFASINDVSQLISSTGSLNVIDIGLLNLNSDTLTLSGRPGFTDTFIIRATGSFDVSQSTIALVNTDAAHILWYFPTADSHILINKDSTVFNGTILAPFTTLANPVTYHNPATFNGAIIARDIDVHSDFNINQVSFVPEPASLSLLAIAGVGLLRRRVR
jgi:choice-of-anchor A domain-containing protein